MRRLVPRPLRAGASAQLAEWRSAGLRRRLATLGAETRPIVVGPWLGEVGFELLYWIPFLRWFAREYGIASERLTAISRGGPASWYRPFAGSYQDVFDYASGEDFRREHERRVRELGEQKQLRPTGFEQEIVAQVAGKIGLRDAATIHPSVMYELFRPYWWGHVDDRWVHRHARFMRLSTDADAGVAVSRPYAVVKFYFNDCFADTQQNRAFAQDTVCRLAEGMPVVSLTTDLGLDDHTGIAFHGKGVARPPLEQPRSNLEVQSALISGASLFVGTYGGFSYLAPFCGVRAIAYYSDERGFARRHLDMARSAFASLGAEPLLDVRPLSVPITIPGDL